MSGSSEELTDGNEEHGAIQWGMTTWLVKRGDENVVVIVCVGQETGNLFVVTTE
jgi:hypothetical protein